MRTTTILQLLVAVPGLLCAMPSAAQAPAPIPVQAFAPAPPGSDFFTLPPAKTPGDLAPSLGVVFSYAYLPLRLETNGLPVPNGQLVRDQAWAFAQASLGLGGRFRIDAVLPVALYQTGNQTFSDVPVVTSTALGDLRLGGQVFIGSLGPVGIAAGLDVWVPTGSRSAYASSGSVSALPKIVAGGEAGPIVFGAQAGVLLAKTLDVGYASTGSGFAYAGGVAWRLGDFLVGPEIWGQVGFNGTGSPLEALLGGHWKTAPFDLGLAVSTGIVRDPGAAPFRVILSGSWGPSGAKDRPPQEFPADTGGVAPAPPPPPLAVASPAPPAEERAPPVAPTPAPAPKESTTQVVGVVHFPFKAWRVRAGDEPLLRAAVAAMAAHPDAKCILVGGHADATGPAAYNDRLSVRRAESVRRWLVAHGVLAERIEVIGYGSSRPVETNETAKGRASNRRVEVVVRTLR